MAKCEYKPCGAEFTPRRATQHFCCDACQIANKRGWKDQKICRTPGCNTVLEDNRRTYCPPCSEIRKIQSAKKASEKYTYEQAREAYAAKKAKKRIEYCFCCNEPFETNEASERKFCDKCGRSRPGNGGNRGSAKKPDYTAEDIIRIKAAHGGKGEICLNCKKPFLRSYAGQAYCLAEECRKIAEREREKNASKRLRQLA